MAAIRAPNGQPGRSILRGERAEKGIAPHAQFSPNTLTHRHPQR